MLTVAATRCVGCAVTSGTCLTATEIFLSTTSATPPLCYDEATVVGWATGFSLVRSAIHVESSIEVVTSLSSPTSHGYGIETVDCGTLLVHQGLVSTSDSTCRRTLSRTHPEEDWFTAPV